MTFNEEQIEWIVVEVLRRLGVAGGERFRVARVERSSTPLEVQIELTMKESVITLRSLEGRLAGIARLIVQPRAVVTPAVKDELKQRNIELVRETRA